MRNVSITEARKGLSRLAQSDQAFTLTSRGQDVAQVRIFATAKFDPVKAKEAAERIFAIGARAKPSKKFGAIAMVRKVRDGA